MRVSAEPLADLLPLMLARVEVNDRFVTLFGPGWTLNVNCDWTLRRGGRELVTADSEVAPQRIALEDLVGRRIVRTTLTNSLFDPDFTFDDGHELVIRADTDLDPWVMHVEGLPYVIVGYGPGGHQEWLAAHPR